MSNLLTVLKVILQLSHCSDSLLIRAVAEQGGLVFLETEADLYRPVSMKWYDTTYVRLLLHYRTGQLAICLETALFTVHV